jgi:hypothetical protein
VIAHDATPAYFGMLKSTSNLNDLWKEWTEPGFIRDRPSVQQMEDLHGEGKWLDDRKEKDARRWYRRRKVIIAAIRAQPTFSPADPRPALQAVTATMQTLRKTSLDAYGKYLVTERNKQKTFVQSVTT